VILISGSRRGFLPNRGATVAITDEFRLWVPKTRPDRWDTRDQLANAIFDWIETWYNPRRRHSYCEMLSPIDYETATAA
jgi:transposase InsO family protein